VHKLSLLLGRELDHRTRVVGIAEGAEDPAVHAKVGVAVVGELLGALEAEDEFAKLVANHITYGLSATETQR